MNCSPRYTKNQNISGDAQALPGGTGSSRQGCPDDDRRQCSLNPYALPTVIVRRSAAGFPTFFPSFRASRAQIACNGAHRRMPIFRVPRSVTACCRTVMQCKRGEPDISHNSDMVSRRGFARTQPDGCMNSLEGRREGRYSRHPAGVRRRCAKSFAVRHSQFGSSDVRMLRDGPPRMVGRSTWSGRERSSHSRFPPVPRVRLVTFAFSSCASRASCSISSQFLRRSSPVLLLRQLARVAFGFRAFVRVCLSRHTRLHLRRAVLRALSRPFRRTRAIPSRTPAHKAFGAFRFIGARGRC